MSHHINPDIKRLCVERMREAFDPRTGLFSRQLRNRAWAPTEGTEEITSTAICLIAASRAGIDPRDLGVDLRPTIARVFEACSSRYPGGLGLAIWMNAAWDGDPLTGILTDGVPGVHGMTTMEASWMLCG